MTQRHAQRNDYRRYGTGTAANVDWDPQLGMQTAKILPGEYFVTGHDVALVTVLGSCVAACIRDPGARIGGMNHFILPEAGKDADAMPGSPARYGVHAMAMLIDGIVKLGARRNALEAKVFGGGNVLRNLSTSRIGTRNAEFVLRFLAAARIPVLAQDLASDYARKVCYYPSTGHVRLQKLPEQTMLRQEREHGQRIEAQPAGGAVELF